MSPNRCRPSCAASAALPRRPMATGTRRRSARCRSSTATRKRNSTSRLPPATRWTRSGRSDHYSRIACADGSFLNDDNECERRRGKAPLAKRDEKVRQESFREQLRPEVSAAMPQASGSGQVVLRYGRLPPGAARLSHRIPNLRPGRPLGRWRRQRSDLQMMGLARLPAVGLGPLIKHEPCGKPVSTFPDHAL
jgi:hypothetical protein